MVMTLDERIRDKLKRHGPESPNARANPERDDYIRAAARRVADRLAAVGRRDPALEQVGEQPGNHSKRQGYAALAVLAETPLSESSAATGNMVPDGG
jgi:hypothetical protein